MKAMAKAPQDRYASAKEMADDLRGAMQLVESGVVQPPRPMTRLIVLPFRMLRPDPEIDFLSFSLSDALSTTLYKIPKIVEKFAERWTLAADRLGEVDFVSRAAMLERACEVIEEMVGLLRKGMNIDTSKALNDKMQAIEAEADRLILELYRDTYAKESDPMRYLILKDLFELLEKAIDRCRDAGNVVHQIVLKNS